MVGKVYWTDQTTMAVGYLDPATGAVAALWSDPSGTPTGIAIDGQTLVWASYGPVASSLWAATVDGSGDLASSPSEVLTMPNEVIFDVAAGGGDVFFVGSRTDSIYRAPIGQWAATRIASRYRRLPGAMLFGVHESAGKVYWSDGHAAKVFRADHDGTNLEVVVNSRQFDPVSAEDNVVIFFEDAFGPSTFFPYGNVAVLGTRVYWFDRGNGAIHQGLKSRITMADVKLRSIDLDGTGAIFDIERGLAMPGGLSPGGASLYYSDGACIRSYDPATRAVSLLHHGIGATYFDVEADL